MSTPRLPQNRRNDMSSPVALKVDLCPLEIFIILFDRFESLNFLSKAKAAG